MNLTILAVGQMKAGPEADLYEIYRKRFQSLGRQLGLTGIDDLSVKSGGGLMREGERLTGKLARDATCVRLDEHGPMLSSIAFAEKLQSWRDAGERSLVFLIGGAEGYAEPVKRAAPNMLAFGPQTWPHMLVRVMLAEQIYRAASILAGRPYHKA